MAIVPSTESKKELIEALAETVERICSEDRQVTSFKIVVTAELNDLVKIRTEVEEYA